MIQSASGGSPRPARAPLGFLSAALTRVGQWLWTQLVSPLLGVVQSLKRWFSSLLGAARRTGTLGGASAAQAMPAPACAPPAMTPQGVSAAQPDLTARWQDLRAKLAAGLVSLRQEPELDAKATGYVMGLQLLQRQVESASPQIQRLAADASSPSSPVRRGPRLRALLLEFLLPVADTLHRGQQAFAREVASSSALCKLRTLYTHISGPFHDLLALLEVREIHPTGQRFDPREHEAVVVEDDPSVPRGHVLAVYRPGFWLGAQLLRPAQVGVTR